MDLGLITDANNPTYAEFSVSVKHLGLSELDLKEFRNDQCYTNSRNETTMLLVENMR